MSAPPTPVDDLLDSLPRLVLVVGKGGVGKTTTAAALGIRCAERGVRTLLLSTDPAGTLRDALDAQLGPQPAPINGAPGLDAVQMDAASLRHAFLERWREVIVQILDRGTYLDLDDIGGLVDAALPGADEVFAVLRLGELARDEQHARIIVDTAPTGHTLRLLALPRTFEALVNLLDTMQAKHRFMVRALTHTYRADRADAFLASIRAEVTSLREMLGDPSRAAAVVVERPEPMVQAETARLIVQLRELEITVGARIMNVSSGTAAGAGDWVSYMAPDLGSLPPGPDGLRRWAHALAKADAPGLTPAAPVGAARFPQPTHDVPIVDLRSLVRPLTIVAGKGGVGKTTVACTLAIAAASAASPTLLVSTDPAPSVADALAFDVPDEETPVSGVPGLVARQMDASAAFERLREAYQLRIDALFDAFVARGVDARHDRAILRDLLALAPPGVDELYALASLGETLAEGRFARVIVDPAPTGHLLRLLEMPVLALDWSHRLMRLMLKYREVTGLDDTAEELLAFAKRTRAIETLLHDPLRAGVLIVAIDEPLVRAESLRLRLAVEAQRIDIVGLVWNRTTNDRPHPLPGIVPASQYSAPAWSPAPIGVDAIRTWGATWRAGPPPPAA